MNDEAREPSETNVGASPGAGPSAGDHRGTPRQTGRPRTVMYIVIGIVGFLLILLGIGVIPRLRNNQELAAAAQRAQNNVPSVYVVRPEQASDADLTLAA